MWKHKEVWTQRDSNFTVEVSRHEVEPRSEAGPWRWCVYAYIYPSHSLFPKFDVQGGIFQPTCNALPLHVGASYFHVHTNEAACITSFQVGADYNHLHDERFTHMATKEEAYEVFDDAERLIKFLERYSDDSN